MATNKNNAYLPNLEPFYAAGIDPKTGLPVKMGGCADDSWRKQAIKRSLRILDEQNAVNRYVWYNLPCNLTSQELERMLYYKGQLAFFYSEPLDEFYFMPYALDGSIDFYGRFNRIHPVPFSGGTTDEEKKQVAVQRDYLSTLKLNCVYDVKLDLKPEDITNSCVLLHDYTKQMSQNIIPRQEIQDNVLDLMSDCIPFMRTALLNSTGVQGMRVQSEDEQSNVKAASASINRAALNGEKYIPVIGNVDFQDLTGGNVSKSEEFLLAMQALDNFRLSLYGLDNGGLFQKKSHMLEAEQEMNNGNIGLILQDGLAIRQNFCDIVNSIWGLGIYCEIAEPILNVDTNMDGQIADQQDQSGLAEGQQDVGGVTDADIQ